MRRPALLLPVVLAALAGCAKIFGFDELEEGTSSDAGAPDEPPDPAPDAATVDAGPPGPVVAPVASFHVSPAGDDTADGSTSRPLRSLDEAVRRASAALDSNPEERQTIALCTGDYVEPSMAVLGPIEVRGNFDCAQWTQGVLRTGGAGIEDVSATRIQESGQADVFITADADERGAPLLEGLSVITSQVGISVKIGHGAVARQLNVVNASLPTLGVQGVTVALFLDGTSTLVEHCNLTVHHPWPANTPTPNVQYTAVGAIANGKLHRIERTFVNVDPVLGACQGLAVQGGSLEATENLIVATGCSRLDAKAISEVGIAAQDSDLQSTRNAIQLESPGSFSTTVPAVAAGIASVGALGTLTSDGDRIVGPGTVRSGSENERLQVLGVLSNGPALDRVVNASIWIRGGTFELVNSAAIRIEVPRSGLVAHNTVFTQSSNLAYDGGSIPALAFYVGTPAAGTSAVQLQNNLAITTTATHRVVRGDCSRSLFDTLNDNRYAGMQQPTGGDHCLDGGDWADLLPRADASGNFALDCDGGCTSWLSPSAVQVLNNGFRVVGDCAQLAAPASSAVTTDATGAPRASGVGTVGAVNVACSPGP